MKPWRRVAAERLQRCKVFELDRVRYAPPDGGSAADFYIIDAPDWVNIIALTGDRRVVLVRQFRFGTAELSLEIPGGMCDPGEEPLAAARRELLEETGYVSDDWVELGWVHPNSALQTNKCHHFLARAARRTAEPTPDEHEAFEVETAPLDDIAAMIGDSRITHALVVSAFYRLGTVSD